MDKPFSTVPRYLDEKERLFFWTLDECFVILAVVLLGVLCNYLITSLFVGFVCQFLYTKIKSRLELSVLSHILYWILPTRVLRFLKSAPDVAIREYVG
jgi:type IV conjugative transfer system protein TraL